MSNCPPKNIKKVNCEIPSKCNGTYSNLDRVVVTGNLKKESKLSYSRSPYECPPETTCLVECINTLPNIPKETYNIYSNAYPGNSLFDYSRMVNNFNNQCSLK
jgi:hypothetical protein